MSNTAESRTSPTLLGRLRDNPADPVVWNEFVDRYGPKIYAWCRQWKVQNADAEDITQTVLLKLAHQMRTFAYDPARSFRGWLRTLAHHAWRDLDESQQRAGTAAGNDMSWQVLQKLEAREDLMLRLEEQFDRELLDEAMTRVQRRVNERTWQAFVLLAVDGLSGVEAAEKLELTMTGVFVAKHRVQRMLHEEVAKLDDAAIGHAVVTPQNPTNLAIKDRHP